jgi:hypothetical protein
MEDTEDGYDVFGDGTIRCWQTPGHAPGHQSFEVTLPNSLCVEVWPCQVVGRSIGRPAACQAGQPPATSAAPRHAVSFERLACWQR